MTWSEPERLAVGEALRTSDRWHPAHWRRLEVRQHPGWAENERLAQVRDRLAARPPLVTSEEVVTLRRQLTKVAYGRSMLVQLGDCAETFDPPALSHVERTAGLVHRAARVIEAELSIPTVTIGRIAGQFAKPRSSSTEEVGGMVLPSFRGFLINDLAPDPVARRPDPFRMLRGYEHAARTLALLRQVANVRAPMRGHWGEGLPALWTSHEALVLDYEEPLTRWDPGLDAWVNSSAHLPWVGERTREIGGAHVQFLAQVVNPVGCKVGPATTEGQILRLAGALDPDRQPGRLVLIARLGSERVEAVLPGLAETVRRAGHLPVWLCDPMHGNTIQSRSGRKTRHVGTLLAEIGGFVRALARSGAWPGGLHLEGTEEPVTECLGGRCGITDDDLHSAYLTACDPRLNAEQVMEVVEVYADLICRSL